MKKILLSITCFVLANAAIAQLPTDTSYKQNKTQRDTLRKDTTKLKGGAIIDTNRQDTIHKKVEMMRPKSKDDLKDTVPQNRR